MLNSKTLLFSTILIAYLGFKFNNIYVIDNFEDPYRYKAFYSSVYIFSAIVRHIYNSKFTPSLLIYFILIR